MRYLCFKYVNISVVLILLFIGGGCEKSDNYKITGMLYGFADNTKVSLTLAATHQDTTRGTCSRLIKFDVDGDILFSCLCCAFC